MTESEYRAQMEAIRGLEAQEGLAPLFSFFRVCPLTPPRTAEKRKRAKEAAEFGLSLEEYEAQIKAMNRFG